MSGFWRSFPPEVPEETNHLIRAPRLGFSGRVRVRVRLRVGVGVRNIRVIVSSLITW
jgi:hypothetical protein